MQVLREGSSSEEPILCSSDSDVGSSSLAARRPCARARPVTLAIGLAVAAALCVAVASRSSGGALVQGPDAGDEVEVVRMEESCEILWGLSLPMMIAQGWGHRVWILATVNERFANWYKCIVVMPEKHYKEFHDWGLKPPGCSVDADSYMEKLQAPVQSIDPTLHLGLMGYWPGEALNGIWTGWQSTQVEMYQDLAGCHDPFDITMWEMFQDVVAKHEKPVQGDYVGLHVRHGDKIAEGFTVDLKNIMDMVQAQSQWADMKNVFVATDDSTVLREEIPAYRSQGYNFSWTHYARHDGGEPDTCVYGICHHDSNAAATKAVLDDTLSLANAAVMVGSFNSNFFKLPWLLNYLRRTPEQRQEHWCWDAFSQQPCHDRKDFVASFLQQARADGVPYLPSDVGLIRSCDKPFNAQGCLEGVGCPPNTVMAKFDDMMRDMDFR